MDTVRAVREFNRFYTKQIGALKEGLLDSPFSLTEMRILYELYNCESLTAKQIQDDLALDQGYVSRILKDFHRSGLVSKARSEKDGREFELSLTADAKRHFADLDARSSAQVNEMLGHLSEGERRELTACLGQVRALLRDPQQQSEVVLRHHEPGDLGWITYRHGALYARQYGYGPKFEAIVAKIVSDFLTDHDPMKERCWVADRDRDILGSIFLVKNPEVEGQAKLRLLYVEPRARGLGLGRRLVRECVDYARAAGYQSIILWTQSELAAARNLYREAGFKKTGEEEHDLFGSRTTAETWLLEF